MILEPLHNTLAGMTGPFSGVAGIWPDFGIDDGTGLLMPALAGVVAAITVALALIIHSQAGYRSHRDMIRHGLVAAIGLTLFAFAIFDVRNVALAHIAKTHVQPTAQFELQWQQTTERARTLAAEMNSHAHQG